MSSKVYRDCDAIGIAHEGDLRPWSSSTPTRASCKVRAWPAVHRGDLGETVSMFIAEHYAHRTPPRLLLSPVPVFDGLQSWLDERRGSSVEVRTPQRGDLENLATLARQNAEIQLQRMATKSSGSLEQRAADEGAKTLGMNQLDHIVCFDMAQLQGDERVGASVVMRNGRPAKSEYRKYIVKGDALDDLRMMKEVVVRWAKRQEEWPDLLLIDGGETHLSTIQQALEEHGWADRFPLAALAKREETVFRYGHDPLCSTVQAACVHARDEAHRSSTPSTANDAVELVWPTRWRAWRARRQKTPNLAPTFRWTQRHRARRCLGARHRARHRPGAGRTHPRSPALTGQFIDVSHVFYRLTVPKGRTGEPCEVRKLVVAELGFGDRRLPVGHGRLLFLLLEATATDEHHHQQQHDGWIDPELNQEVQPTNLNSEGQVVLKFTRRNDVGDRLTSAVLGDDQVAR